MALASDQFYCKACVVLYDRCRDQDSQKSGHERSLTQIKFNAEGDLLFSCSKDHVINVWFSHNGERLGTYDGHNGTVWTIDVDCGSDWCPSFISESSLTLAQSRFLVSGSADNQLRLWNVSNGKCLYVWEFPTAVKWVAFNDDDESVVCITEQRMGFQGAIRVFRLNRNGDGTDRSSFFSFAMSPLAHTARVYLPLLQNHANLNTCSTPSVLRPPCAHLPTCPTSSSPDMSPARSPFSTSPLEQRLRTTSGHTWIP